MKRTLILASILFLAACAPTGPHRPAPDRANLVTLKGEPITLEGRGVKVGEVAPDCIAIANDRSTQKLSEYRGVVVVLSFVPSLETKVCDRETRTFNEKAITLGDNSVVLTVSTDTPEVQKNWCGSAGITRVITLSDAKLGEFGRNFGVRIKENGRLARAVYVIDAKGVIRYEQIVKELSTEPNYTAALDAAHNAAELK